MDQSYEIERAVAPLPNEILVKIFEYTSRQTLQNLRRCSHLFCDIASRIFFRTIILPSSQDHLHLAVDVLTQPHVGIHVRQLSLSCDKFMPDEYKSKFYLERNVEENALESVTDFTSQLTRLLFSPVKKNLQRLIITGFNPTITRLSWHVRSFMERPYFRGVVDVLSLVDLPALREIEMKFNSLTATDPLLEIYRKQKDQGVKSNLVSNVEQLSSLALMRMNTRENHDVTDVRGTKEFLAVAENIPQLVDLKLILPGMGTMSSHLVISLAQVSNIRTLRSLCLHGACLSDPLTPILGNLTILRSLTIWAIKLDVNTDTWEKVFLQTLDLQELEDLDVRNCGYLIFGVYSGQDHEPVGLCSAYEEDRLSFGRVRERIKMMKFFRDDPEQITARLNKWDVCMNEDCWISFLALRLSITETS